VATLLPITVTHKKGRQSGDLFCLVGFGSDLVAKRSLDLALQILAFATAFLRDAFAFKNWIVRCATSGLLDVSSDFIANAFGFVGQFAHDMFLSAYSASAEVRAGTSGQSLAQLMVPWRQRRLGQPES
jgi:hypothetical protein